LEPIGSEANSAIADLLTRAGAHVPDHENKIHVDGYERLTYEVPYSVVRQMEMSPEYRGKFRTWVREGMHGKVRAWRFRRWPARVVIRKRA
jgi:hypothetical protein